MSENIRLVKINEWVFQVRMPEGKGLFPVILMLHGLTGDEKSMWVFSSRLPSQAMIIAPRGLYRTPLGGYTWHPHQPQPWPSFSDFIPTVEKLTHILTEDYFPQAEFSVINLVGFSQGAALALSFLLKLPGRVNLLAGLSGFLPLGAADLALPHTLDGKRIFLAHGVQDEQIPVERARQTAMVLEAAGADVIYCEDDIGHKISASCFRGLEAFFAGDSVGS